nr:MAG TPA_asm: hypothetical protein [Bacteriophage sp.]
MEHAAAMKDEGVDTLYYDMFIADTTYVTLDVYGMPIGEPILKKQFSRLVAKPEY